MSGLLNKHPWPNDSMTDYFIVDADSGALKNKQTGKYLTWDPAGFWRESDSVAGYEQMQVNGALAVYNPVPPDGSLHPTGFLYWSEVPGV